MKKYIILSIGLFILTTTAISQTFEMRTFLNDYDYIAVQLRQTALGAQPDPISNVDAINDFVFTMRWLQSVGDVDVDLICTNYNITESGSRTAKESYYYQQFGASSALLSPDNYVLNEWVTIATIQTSINASTSSGAFELAPNAWVGNLLVTIGWDDGGSTQYFPTLITGSCNDTPIPTIVYDYVWTGAVDNFWDNQLNWIGACGGVIASAPNTGNNCYIQDVTNQPNNVNAGPNAGGHQPFCDYLRVAPGATLSCIDHDVAFNVPALQAQLTYTVNNDLMVYGEIILLPNSQLTVTESTYLDAAECLIVQATSAGVGSFIDNGTITYGTGGTAKVQTYLTGSGSAGTFDFHCVGPTVDITGTGVTLSAFDVVPGETYAYKYDEPTNDWTNYYQLTDPVPTAKGIGLSTNDGSTNTMEMTGELKTGPVSSEAMTTTADGYYLLSNPYPSSIFWDNLYSHNGTVLDEVYVLDDGFAGNYLTYNQTSGGTNNFNGYIQVGQGFFVDAESNVPFTFANTDRHHSDDPFYKSRDFTNRLDVRVTGNESTDGLLVHFYEGAISGYEANEDVAKKMSYSENATQFWTVLDDGQHMSINAMPLELLSKGMQSVPVDFICSATDEYTMNFYDMETFEAGTEIWLEDKQLGSDWISVNDNPDYTFTATPDDAEDRFIIHFFGPTGVDELNVEKSVEIYSHRQFAYIRNHTSENIKKVGIYTLSGALLQDIETADLDKQKFWVSDILGYYVVRVITDENVYTQKVFISK